MPARSLLRLNEASKYTNEQRQKLTCNSRDERAGKEEKEEEEKGDGRSTPDSQPPRRPEGRQGVGGCGRTTSRHKSKERDRERTGRENIQQQFKHSASIKTLGAVNRTVEKKRDATTSTKTRDMYIMMAT